MKRLLLAAIALLAVPAAWALSPAIPYGYPITIGTTAAQVLGADTIRKRVIFINPNTTALVAVCPAVSRVDSTAITCTVNGAGSITLLPYQSITIDGAGQNGTLPSAWNAIADTPSSHLTILEFE